MAGYDAYERDNARRGYLRDDRWDDREALFVDPRDYGRPMPSRELVPRAREESDLSVEEIRRDFPPPSGRDIRRARSADHERRYYADGHDHRHDPRHDRHRDHDRQSRRGSFYYEEEDRRSKRKSTSKQDKIIAAVAGAALLAGGKEIYDRYEANKDGNEVQRNPLSSVALAGFGALAGYQGAQYYSKQQAVKDQKASYILHRGRDGQVSEYYSEDDDADDRHKKGHKNFLENALAATGLGAAVKTLTGGAKDDGRHSDNRSRGGSPSRSRAGSPRSRSGATGANKMQQAAMASLLAGATEAFRVAKEPGGWKGEKTKRILTAAAGAATVDAAHGDKQGRMALAESVIGGLVGNRLINGSKRDIEEDKATGRSRSRSRARSGARGGGGSGGTGLAALATAGLGALGAKAALDHRSRSRSRSRGRAGSRDRSYDSRDGSPDRRHHGRSRSVVDKARNSLAKLGIGTGSAATADDHRRRDQDDFDDRASSRRPGRYSDEYSDDGRYGGGRGRRGDDYEYERSHRRDSSRTRGGGRYGSESDLGDSDEDERKARKMRGKQIITTGLATVATIHAAHGVYQSMEKRRARQRAVKEGRLSPAEARKLRTKAVMKDAASVGIAALGINGAVEEMKEAKEMTHECKAFKQEKALRHEKRERRRKRGSTSEPGNNPERAGSWAPSRYRDGGDLLQA
ncbi:uncharacterized protein MAM_03648 [Metarhizium album ARSEF 1941]|uniref:DUF3824 domain-containing protein n=1 Tax=Metarhizium album (strain ARSEF 1941) TaxID=1081103 RepID=A0A0B2WY45_METAS|nr:uncharacterized protein MAM_03648 [Metarhizium album ARSEF 1941]KHN98524.1 hypothetical protein MAM_03648 [Metarhizium album ARSEF 1941]